LQSRREGLGEEVGEEAMRERERETERRGVGGGGQAAVN